MKFKKSIALFSAVAISLSCMIGTSAIANADTTSPDNATKIMCIGDSITDGYGTAGSYRKFLYHNLTEDGYSIDMVGSKTSWALQTYTDADTSESFEYDDDNTGYSGYAIKEYSGRSGIYETLQSTNCLATTSPDVVILQIGTNDVIDNHEIESSGERLDVLINYILDNISSDSALFVTTIPDLDPNRTDVYSWFSNYRHSSDWQTSYSDDVAEENVHSTVKQYNEIVKNEISTLKSEGVSNVYFGDVNSSITDVTTQLKDGVHPNDIGYSLMGNYWTSVIEAYLSGEKIETSTTTEDTTESVTEATTTVEETESVTTTITTEVTTTVTEPETTTSTTEVTTTEIIPTETEITILKGDVNSDNSLTVSDVVSLGKYLIKKQTFTYEQYSIADVNEDNKVNVTDLAVLKSKV